jgi:hypothetical protein
VARQLSAVASCERTFVMRPTGSFRLSFFSVFLSYLAAEASAGSIGRMLGFSRGTAF